MGQLLLFAFNLAIIAWLRTAVVARPRTDRFRRWCVELCFGVLIALPLLGR
jgi:hypothetical protein